MPSFPMPLLYLWQTFIRIRRRKASYEYSGASKPLEWPDIDAFCRRTRTDLQPWEIEMIERLDDLLIVAGRVTDDPEGDDGN